MAISETPLTSLPKIKACFSSFSIEKSVSFFELLVCSMLQILVLFFFSFINSSEIFLTYSQSTLSVDPSAVF